MRKWLLFVVGLVGFGVLWMFPEPENNFILYILTGFGFVGVLFWVLKKG